MDKDDGWLRAVEVEGEEIAHLEPDGRRWLRPSQEAIFHVVLIEVQACQTPLFVELR